MKLPFTGILMILAFVLPFFAKAQTEPKPVYVIVHGAWGGSWAFKKVDSLMTEEGCIVYRPSLTGQGERVHLASKDIGLYTHIHDVVNMILYEDLRNIVLVGHSYGGMVISGVADSLPARIREMIYLDAFVPKNGESALGMRGASAEQAKWMAPTGFIIPQWVPEGKLPPKDVPHPIKTLTDTLFLKNPQRLLIPTTYILTVDKGKEPASDDFAASSERARENGWRVIVMEADHNPQWSATEELVSILMKIGR